MRNYSLKMFFKYLTRNKLYTFVTLSGFAVSLMFVVLLSVYIKQELSVDQFHSNKDRIFRLIRDNEASFSPPTGAFISTHFPGVESYTRIYRNSWNSKFQEKQQEKVEYLLADSSFFTMFSFKLREGNPAEVLALKNSAGLSSSFARKIFGNENPVGKTFLINQISLIITGVFEEMPVNTHFEKCDAIINFNVLAELWGWKELLTTNDNSSFGLYIMAKRGADLPSKAPQILELFKKDYWVFSQGFSKTLGFEPLTSVYFSKAGGPAIRQNSRTSVFIFGAITLLILIIAIINYINLTVAQSGFRAKETAVKKIMGGSKIVLLSQHIFESVILTFLASIVAIILAFVAEPFFNTQMDCSLNLRHQFKFSMVLIMLGIIITTGFISGIIPAIVVNKFNLIDVIKGSFARKSKATYSKILIAFQYTIAIILIICTWTISRQAKFMQNYNTGFNKENLFYMENTITSSQKTAFRNILKSIPGVIDVSFCRGTPLDGGNNQSFNYKDKPVSFQEFVVDSVFFKVMGIKINKTDVAFSKNGVWINKAATKILDLGANPVSFRFYNNDLPVLGIIEDFNFRSLRTKIGPLIVRQLTDNDLPWGILVKLEGTNLISTADKIKQAQASFTSGVPMESGFVDEAINQFYIKEVKQSRLIGAFTILSIIISSMGIFAMALYYIQQKVKEIGVRKINGAEVSEVIIMLNKNFINWVALAFIIASPVAWILMHKWLQNFAFRTELTWWIIAMAGILALGVALLTVSWQSWKAARRNPVEALRYE
jgi:putative ABC transport system permease protein